MLRLYVEEERNERAFEALTRFLEAVDALPAGLRGRAALDPLALAFQLKLLWLSGYVPHLESCVECGAEGARRLPAARGRRGLRGVFADGGGRAVPGGPARDARPALEPARGRAWPRPRGASGARRARGRRRVVRVPRRLPPAHPVRVKRDLGDGYELDDDPARIDREAVHRYLIEESYWAKGRPREVQDELIDGPRESSAFTTRGGRSASRARSRTASACVPRRRLRARGVPWPWSRGELVRFSVDESPFAGCRWMLHTADAHDLYRKFGFAEPDERGSSAARAPVFATSTTRAVGWRITSTDPRARAGARGTPRPRSRVELEVDQHVARVSTGRGSGSDGRLPPAPTGRLSNARFHAAKSGTPCSTRKMRITLLRRLPVLGQLVLDESARACDRDPLLRERVAVADRHRVVLERLLVDRERVRRADLVLAPVAAADLARVVVLGDDRPAELLVQPARLRDHVLVPRDQREHRDLDGRQRRMQPEHGPLALGDDLLVVGVDHEREHRAVDPSAGSTTYGV